MVDGAITYRDAVLVEYQLGLPPRQTPCASVVELRARVYHSDDCWCICPVAGVAWAWQYDAASVSADNGTTVLKPDDVAIGDPGRWLLDETQQHNHDDAYPALVDLSVIGNFPSFSDTHGQMQDSGYKPADFATAGHGHSATPGAVIFAGAMGAYSEDASHFRWDLAHYYLGINTDSPSTFLTVKAGVTKTDVAMVRLASPHNWVDLGAGDAHAIQWTTAGGPIGHVAVESDGTYSMLCLGGLHDGATFKGLSDHVMVVRGDGRVGIGTTDPLYPLDVRGTVSGAVLRLYGTTSGALVFHPAGTTVNGSYIWPADYSAGAQCLMDDGAGNLYWGASGITSMETLTNGDGLAGNDYDGSTPETWSLDLASANVWQATQTWRMGTTAAGTAPQKFQTGTLMTTPEAGALEWDGTDLWITIGGVGSYPFTLEIVMSGAGTFTLPLVEHYNTSSDCQYNAIVDWGDGSENSVITAYDDAERVHTYATAGTYQIKITGTLDGFSFNNTGDKLKVTRVVHWGTSDQFAGFKYLKGGFSGCSNLTQIGTGPIGASPTGGVAGVELDGFSGTFLWCPLITEIPVDLFRLHTAVTTDAFRSTFYEDFALRIIPEDLFRYNVSASSYAFSATFYRCYALETVPAMFWYNTAAVSYGFRSTFQDCKNLQLHSEIFCASGDKSTRFLNQSVSFDSTFRLTTWSGSVKGTAPDLWNYSFGSGTPNKNLCFSGQSTSSLTNYASIPAAWR